MKTKRSDLLLLEVWDPQKGSLGIVATRSKERKEKKNIVKCTSNKHNYNSDFYYQ